MRCLAEADLHRYADLTLPFLRRDPVRNNLAYTIVDSRRSGRIPAEPGALWLRVTDGDTLVTVALQTPPSSLLLTTAPPEAVAAVAGYLLVTRPDLPGVSGPVAEVGQFVDEWQAATGVTARRLRRQRLYRLDRVHPPAGVPGGLRPAAPGDRPFLRGWFEAFRAEATPESPPEDPDAVVDRALAREGAMWLWEVDGEAVTMVGVTAAVAGVARVAPVYTPPPRRGRGYAGAATAAVSQQALDRRAEACMLYTDLDNSTSNRVYQRVGYRPVAEAAQWRLS